MSTRLDMSALVADAFAAGATHVAIHRGDRGYHAHVGVDRQASDGAGRYTNMSASAHGHGETPEEALAEAMGKLRPHGAIAAARERGRAAALERRAALAQPALPPSSTPALEVVPDEVG